MKAARGTGALMVLAAFLFSMHEDTRREITGSILE